MKIQILIISLLIASIFASSFALGETDKLSEIKAKTICKSLKGDANNDGKVDISDSVFINMHLNGEAKIKCPNNADLNADGQISEQDRDYLLNYLFKGGPVPVETVKQVEQPKEQKIIKAEEKQPVQTTKPELKEKEIGEIEINKAEKDKTLDKINSFEEKKVGFTKTYDGFGWITNENSGYRISAFWTLQKFFNKEKIEEKAFGKLKISDMWSFDLTLDERTENSFEFLVEENGQDIGKLILIEKANLNGLTLWTGNLLFTSSELSGTWKVELATDYLIVKPAPFTDKPETTNQKQVIKNNIEQENCNLNLGDANIDGKIDISDAVTINMYLLGEKELQCPNNADLNADGQINEQDRDYLLNYLFKGGPAPVERQEEQQAEQEQAQEQNPVNEQIILEPIQPEEQKNQDKSAKGFWAKLVEFFFG